MIQTHKSLRPLGVERIAVGRDKLDYFREGQGSGFRWGVVVGALLACAGVLLFGLWGMR